MMYDFTLKNHLRLGYDDQLDFQRRLSPRERWQVKYGQIEKRLSFRKAAKAAASSILSANSREPGILLSGGIDSEVCVRAFIEAGVVPTVVIGRFGREEGRDFNAALWVAEHLGLKPTIVDVDVISREGKIRVLQAGIFAQTISPQFATHCLIMGAVAKLGLRPVLAIGDNELRRVGGELVVVEREKEAGAYRFAAQRQWELSVPAFFQYTPELIWSRIAGPGHEVWQDLRHDNYFQVKEQFYQHHYPEIASREKLTGFEHLGWEWDSALRSELRRLLPAGSETELEFKLADLAKALETGEQALPSAVRNAPVAPVPAA